MRHVCDKAYAREEEIAACGRSRAKQGKMALHLVVVRLFPRCNYASRIGRPRRTPAARGVYSAGALRVRQDWVFLHRRALATSRLRGHFASGHRAAAVTGTLRGAYAIRREEKGVIARASAIQGGNGRSQPTTNTVLSGDGGLCANCCCTVQVELGPIASTPFARSYRQQ